VHALPSLHDAALFACAQPVAGLQESVVHELLSLQSTRLPPMQKPVSQWSPLVQALPSSQLAVLGS
jgi:hypothetical protein